MMEVESSEVQSKDLPPKDQDSQEPEPVDLTSSPSMDFTTKHPLQHSWTLWYDNPQKMGKKTSQASWADNLKKIATFSTVEDFWRLFNNIRPPSKLSSGSNYHLFKEDIEPKWEHPENSKGGKWVASVKGKKENLDQMWLWAVLALIGETFTDEEEICGCVVSIRKGQDRVGLWTKTASIPDVQVRLGQQFKKVLELPANEIVGYQSHDDALKRGSSFNNRNRYQV